MIVNLETRISEKKRGKFKHGRRSVVYPCDGLRGMLGGRKKEGIAVEKEEKTEKFCGEGSATGKKKGY